MNGRSTPKEHQKGEGSAAEDVAHNPGFEVTEVGGDRYESLEAALEAALDPVAEALVELILSYLETGGLIVVDGVVKFPDEEGDKGAAIWGSNKLAPRAHGKHAPEEGMPGSTVGLGAVESSCGGSGDAGPR